MAKDIKFGAGARAAMLQGVSEVAEAVKVTMGPRVYKFVHFYSLSTCFYVIFPNNISIGGIEFVMDFCFSCICKFNARA